MAIDLQIEKAIIDCVADANQPNNVAVKLVKWLENSMDGKEDPLERSSYQTHLELIFESMKINEDDEQ